MNDTAAVTQPEEQLRYARWLEWGTRLGLAVLVSSFAAYVFGLLQPQVPVQRLPELWQHPVGRYLELTGAPTGWGWLAQLQHGDVIGLLGIVILSGCSLVCLGALIPLYLKRGDKAFAFLCAAEIAVVLLAASGLAAGGH